MSNPHVFTCSIFAIFLLLHARQSLEFQLRHPATSLKLKVSTETFLNFFFLQCPALRQFTFSPWNMPSTRSQRINRNRYLQGFTPLYNSPGTVSPLKVICTRCVPVSCGVKLAIKFCPPKDLTELVTRPPLTRISKFPDPARDPSTGNGIEQLNDNFPYFNLLSH